MHIWLEEHTLQVQRTLGCSVRMITFPKTLLMMLPTAYHTLKPKRNEPFDKRINKVTNAWGRI